MSTFSSIKRFFRPTRTGVIGWALMLIALGAYVTANVLHLWKIFPWFDRVMHPYTAFALTIMVGNFLYPKIFRNPETHPVFLVAAIAGLGITAGVGWEIYEWIREFISPGDTIRGKYDTMVDLVLDMVGSIAGAVAVLTIQKEKIRRHSAHTQQGRLRWPVMQPETTIRGNSARKT